MATPFHLSSHRRSVVGLILLGGIVLTLAAWQTTIRKESERIRVGFLSRAQTQATVVAQKLRNYEEMVYSLRDAFIGQEAVNRQEFTRVSQSLLQRHAGVQALEWVRIVSHAERTSFEQAFSKEVGRPIGIVSRQPDGGIQPAPAIGEYFVITYVEPVVGNDVVLGYDVQSAPTGPLVAAARIDRQLKVSSPMRLFQSTSAKEEPGVIFILPFWRAGPAGDQPVEGFVQGVFHVRTMLAQSHRLITTSEALDTYYLDQEPAPGSSPLLYANFAGADAGPLENIALPPLDDPLDVHETLTVGNRKWLMVMRPNAAWWKRVGTTQAPTVLVSGLTITALFALFAGSLLQRTRRIEAEVTDRTRELRATEIRLQGIVDHCPAIIFLKDLEGRHIMCNEPFATLCLRPRSEIVGHTDEELFGQAQAAAFRTSDELVLKSGRPIQFEQAAETAAGRRTVIVQKFPLLDEAGKIYALCGIATDITDRKTEEEKKLQLERRLLESQKLESLGVLAGGIAHDFNNILTAILGNASLANLELPADHVVRPQLRQIEQAARRASDLCAQMLAYAGKTAFITSPVSLTTLVRETTALLEVTVGRRARLELQTAANLPAVLGDATQLRQIVMNLVINAADAIGEHSSGIITIQTFVRDLTPEFLAGAVQSPALAAGRYVGLQVTDNGGGMSPEVLARIFEPFFTTKFSGRGLGLAAAVGIVQSHQGALFVESAVGRGTTFRIFLPASDVATDRPDAAAASVPTKLTGTVLVVDDEEAVRMVAMKSLRTAGALVFEAGNGEDGLEIYSAQGGRIDLVLLDLTMPGIGGEETLRRLRAIAPTLPVVVMSGYSEGETMHRCASLGVSDYLAKPFEIAALLEKIRRLLG